MNKNLEKIKDEVYSCFHCGFCREQVDHEKGTYKICSVREIYGFDSYSARGRNSIALALLEGRLKYSPKLVKQIYTCLLCRNCNEHCTWLNLHIDTPEIVKAMREDIVDSGLELDSLKKIDLNVEKNHNVFGKSSSEVIKWAKDLNLPKNGEVLYWSGCYDSAIYPETSKSTVAILKMVDINPAYLAEEEWCCGAAQFANGNKSLAKKMIEHNIETIKASGAKKVITSCAGCYHFFKSEYPKVVGQLPFEVVHISEFVAKLLKKEKIKFKTGIDKKVTYHDPCHLGRYEGIYDSPRMSLEAIPKLELVEMLRNRENAWCCGGGGGPTQVAFPKLTSEIASERIDEAKNTEASSIITTCPFCKYVLSSAAKGQMEVYDFPEIISEAMGLTI